MLEVLNTVAAVGTFVVISATAIAALVQLRHMRVANQLEGLLTVLARVEDAKFASWVTQTQQQMAQLTKDPEYVRSVIDKTFDRSVAWLQLGNSYEWVGSLLKNRLISEEAFLDVYSHRAIETWELLMPFTALSRHYTSGAVWENFEYLYVRAVNWAERHPAGSYPKHVPRAKLPSVELALPLVAHALKQRTDGGISAQTR